MLAAPLQGPVAGVEFWLISATWREFGSNLALERRAMRAASCSFLLLVSALVCSPLAQLRSDQPARASIGLFEAIQAGQIDAKLILRDETAGRVLLTNKTKQPLTIKLPEAFAGIPALAHEELIQIISGSNDWFHSHCERSEFLVAARSCASN